MQIDILNIPIRNENDNNIVLELIDELLKRGCIITKDIKTIKIKNIKLYIILKQKINIPNLTLNDLIILTNSIGVSVDEYKYTISYFVFFCNIRIV